MELNLILEFIWKLTLVKMLFIPNTNIGLQQRGCQNWDYCVMGYLFQIAMNQELFHFNAPGKLYSTGYYPLYRGTGYMSIDAQKTE